ncbi:MAG: hypothetical protein ACR2NX_14515 [Chthoniobacterales bacterium]
MFTKSDRSPITPAEVQTLLEAQSGNFHWGGNHLEGQKVMSPGVVEYRSIDQRSRVAFHDTVNHFFYVTTQAFIDASERRNEEDAKAKLKKF